jgi:excisionase family DNA binding protein
MKALLTRLAPQPVRLLLRPHEAAEALGICERTLWELTRAGEITAIRIPGRGKARSLRYSVADLQNWIEAKKAAQGNQPVENSAAEME